MTRSVFDLLEAGDMLVRPKGPFKHYGIYLPNGKVLHNSPLKGEHASSLAEFRNREEITVYKPHFSDRHYILANVSAVLRNPKGYDIFFNNCEHTFTKVATGKARSEQLIFWATALIVFGIIYIAISRTK